MTEVNIEWRKIYWTRGQWVKGSARQEVTDPPCSGWQHALILKGLNLSTIFCPYSFESFQVTNESAELVTSKALNLEASIDRIKKLVYRRWQELQSLGLQKDYDTCALILRKLNLEVPKQVMAGGELDTKTRGGKETANSLLKPVKSSSKRGKFLQWFIDGHHTQSVRATMAQFNMTRSNALSYLYLLQKDHGIGYTLIGDQATIQIPEGCTNPFGQASEGSNKLPKALEADDDDWLN